MKLPFINITYHNYRKQLWRNLMERKVWWGSCGNFRDGAFWNPAGGKTLLILNEISYLFKVLTLYACISSYLLVYSYKCSHTLLLGTWDLYFLKWLTKSYFFSSFASLHDIFFHIMHNFTICLKNSCSMPWELWLGCFTLDIFLQRVKIKSLKKNFKIKIALNSSRKSIK